MPLINGVRVRGEALTEAPEVDVSREWTTSPRSATDGGPCLRPGATLRWGDRSREPLVSTPAHIGFARGWVTRRVRWNTEGVREPTFSGWCRATSQEDLRPYDVEAVAGDFRRDLGSCMRVDPHITGGDAVGRPLVNRTGSDREGGLGGPLRVEPEAAWALARKPACGTLGCDGDHPQRRSPMTRTPYLTAALFFLITIAGCDEVLAPIVSAQITILGPEYTFGEIHASGSDSIGRCDFDLTPRPRSFGGSSSNHVEWNGAEVTLAGIHSGETHKEILGRRELNSKWGTRIRTDRTGRTATFTFDGPAETYRVTMEVSYFDPDLFNKSFSTTFRGTCRLD